MPLGKKLTKTWDGDEATAASSVSSRGPLKITSSRSADDTTKSKPKMDNQQRRLMAIVKERTISKPHQSAAADSADDKGQKTTGWMTLIDKASPKKPVSGDDDTVAIVRPPKAVETTPKAQPVVSDAGQAARAPKAEERKRKAGETTPKDQPIVIDADQAARAPKRMRDDDTDPPVRRMLTELMDPAAAARGGGGYCVLIYPAQVAQLDAMAALLKPAGTE